MLLVVGCGSGGGAQGAGGANSGGTEGHGGSGTNPDGLAISPASVSVTLNGTVKFKCSLAGAATVCDWSVKEGASGGAVDADGLYTAPGAKGAYHVLAASQADSSKTASATVDVTPPHVSGDCGNLPAVGMWEQTAPQQLLDQSKDMAHQYGLIGLAVDPTDYATVYFGSEGLGIWKSVDCGGSWVHVNTGTHAASIESGFQWSVAVDPVDSQVIYANSGYGADGSFLWRSANGGVDWDQFWPPADPTLADVVEYNFVHKVRIDPTDHQHLLVSFHANCKAPYMKACLAETMDGGGSWHMVNGDASWTGGEDQSVWFLDDAKTWLYGSQSNGLWRTADSGATWTSINKAWGGHNGGQLYRAKDGTFYLSGPAGLLRSEDGVTWALDAKVPSAMCGITGNGTTMWAALGPYRQTGEFLPYFNAEEADGKNWSQFTSPKMFVGSWDLGYNPDRNILYSSNGSGGFWRVVTK